MKFCRFILNGDPRIGVLTDGGLIDITALGFSRNICEIMAGGDALLTRILRVIQSENPPVLETGSIKYLPVSDPQKIICGGLNYKSHAAETGGTPPEHPVFFSKFNDTLSACDEPVTLPHWHEKYDYEAELVIVVGKSAYNVTEETARDYIFGYTCGNDLSARDCQFLSSQWLSGKSFPGFAPVGPYIVTRDSFDPDAPHKITCEVSGTQVQSGDTSDMIFSCAETLAAASRFFPLSPGDLIFTGTPSGVILGRPKDKRVWLKPGDTVKVTIEGIGTLTTPLA